MKHSYKITAILTVMFLITQLIGLFVVTTYIDGLNLPYGLEPPEEITEQPKGFEIIIAFALAVIFFLLLMKFNAETFIRLWYFVVTILALGLAFNVILFKFGLSNAAYWALLIAVPLSYVKIFRKHLITHNLTELFIYPGIAAVFIPLLNITWMIILLFLISIYDIWAVWHSKFMQKMAKFQINKLQIFTGFFVPYADKKQKEKIKLIKQKYAQKGDKVMERQFKKAKIRVNLAILGGGDVIFPIITAGVFYKVFGLLSALIIVGFATLALLGLFMLARKGRFYPAMPFLSVGLYLGMVVSWLVF